MASQAASASWHESCEGAPRRCFVTTALVPLVGTRSTWMRDGATIGAATGALGPAMALLGGGSLMGLLATGVVGGAFGGALGALAPEAVAWMRHRWSLYRIVSVVPLVGFGLGALVGGVTGWMVGAPLAEAGTYGALATGVQLGLFFLPYLVQTVRNEARWPIVVSSVGVSMGLGWVAQVAITIHGWLGL